MSNHFWLRTPNTEWTTNVGVVYPSDGNVGALQTDFQHSARPAFNLDSSAVLFSSPASGGKPDGETSAIGDYSGNEWKLTLKDSSRDGFTIENLHCAGNIITFYYSGAAAGANEYISAPVVDSTGAYTHYGRLQPADEAAGTVVFTLPELPEDSTLYIFNEQCNGDYKTDYASHLVELAVPEDTSGAGEDGREVELKNDGDSILWRYEGEGDDAWQNLIAVSALQGMKGEKGDQGEKGEKGDNGDTPTIGANGNWWISGVDTGVKASGGSASGSGSSSGSSGAAGKDGQDGASGVGIAELALNESGELVVTLTDGTEKNLGRITGEDGVGVAGVAINEKGELIVTLTDGTELNAGAAAPGLEPLVYIALGAAVISLAGMIVMAAYLLAKRKSLLTQA